MTNIKKHPILWALAILLPLTWGMAPLLAAAETSGSYAHPALGGSKKSGQAATAPEGSKTKSYSHGSPHKKSPHHGAPHGSPHGKKEGSQTKSHGSYSHGGGHGSKSYGHGGGHHGKSGGSHSKHAKSGHHASHKKYGKGHGGKNPFKHILCFAKKLGLTEEQIAQIKEKKFEYAKQHIRFEADHTIAHMDLNHLAHSGKLDEAAMRAVGDRLVKIKTAKIQAVVEAKITLLKILTEEQRQKVSQIHSKRKR